MQLMIAIAPLLLPLTIAILIAVALTPALDALVRRWRVPRSLAILLVTLALGLSMSVLLMTVLPSVYEEIKNFIQQLPQMRENLLTQFADERPVRDFIARNLTADTLTPNAEQIQKILGASPIVLGGFAQFFLIFVLAIYLIADGPRVIEWLSAFFKPSTQAKIEETRGEMAKIISAYVVGQFITSALSFIFVFIAMTSLNVPGAMLLATLSGILDVLPVLGFFLAVIPAMLFATHVSLTTSLVVLGLYTFYHVLENYVIVPLVYGNRMRVSSFVVFFSLLAAGLVAGIEGAIVILPIVASYPIIERIWLKRYVRDEALAEHAPEPDADSVARARGESPSVALPPRS